MLKELIGLVPPDVRNIVLVLALGSFIGLEREEHKQREPGYAFGGVRTFPLIALVSYALALIGSPTLWAWMIGFAVVGGLMMLSYAYKLRGQSPAGLTTEISALATYVVGGLVQTQHYWIASTVGILSVLLLEFKKALEGLAIRFAFTEIITVAKFLVLAVVILPVLPDEELTRFHLNPFKTWLVVVVVAGVSFASYVLQRVLKGRGGVMLSALLGGGYSSTVTTIVLARQARESRQPNLYSGGILAASGVMYARLVILISFFNPGLLVRLGPAFGALALAGGLGGWAVSRRGDPATTKLTPAREVRNPLELGAALLFAVIFVGIVVITSLVSEYLGHAGLYALAAFMGVTDVDPFILSLAQRGSTATPISVAAAAITIAASSNNVVKAFYALAFSDRDTGRRSLGLLLALAALGFVPLVWL